MGKAVPFTRRMLASWLGARSEQAIARLGTGGRPFRLAQAGDSRFALQNDGQGISSHTPQHWIGVLSRQRLQAPPYLNGAVGGEKSDQTLARLTGTSGTVNGTTNIFTALVPYFVSQDVTHCLLILPINDHNTGNNYTLAAMKANVQGCIDALNAAGITAVVLTSHPHDAPFTPAWTTQQLDNQANLRAWLLAKAGTPGVIPVDISDIFADPKTGLATTASLKDQTHHTATSAMLVAQRVVNALLPHAALFNALPISSRDVFSADNPLGNLLPNGLLNDANTGTGFFPNAGGATINIQGVASNCYFTAGNATGLTITVSKVDDPVLGPSCQQLEITGTAGAAAPQVDFFLSNGISLASAPVGSQLVGGMGVVVDPGCTGVANSSFLFSTGGAGQFYGDGAVPSAAATPLPAAGWSGVQRIPERAFTVGAGATNLVARIRTLLRANGPVNLKTRWRGAFAQKVA